MESAVNDWFNKTGLEVDSNGEELDLKQYNVLVDIPCIIILHYRKIDPVKRRKLDKSVGQVVLLDN